MQVEATVSVTDAAGGAALFPLALAPVERLMLADDRSSHPMSFFLCFDFTGQTNRSALIEALDEAVERHPLLGTRVAGWPKAPCWVPCPVGPSVILLAVDDPWPAEFAQPIDLRRQPGLRLVIREDGRSSKWLFEIHHACCDGMGALVFLEDMFHLYARRLGSGEVAALPRIDRALLVDRDHFTPVAKHIESVEEGQRRRQREARGFFAAWPQRLARRTRRGKLAVGDADWPGIVTRLFDVEQSEAIRTKVAARACTLNDVAMGLLFRTLAEWNGRYGRVRPHSCLRILMPADLRERADRWLPAANRMGLCFLARTVAECVDEAALIAGVAEQIKHIRRYRLGLDFIDGVTTLVRRPWLARLLMRLPFCLATATLTNVSDPNRHMRLPFPSEQGWLRFGNLILDCWSGSPPLRPGVRAGFGVFSYNGRIGLSLRCDPRSFTLDDTRELLESYATAWTRWADANQGSASARR